MKKLPELLGIDVLNSLFSIISSLKNYCTDKNTKLEVLKFYKEQQIYQKLVSFYQDHLSFLLKQRQLSSEGLQKAYVKHQQNEMDPHASYAKQSAIQKDLPVIPEALLRKHYDVDELYKSFLDFIVYCEQQNLPNDNETILLDLLRGAIDGEVVLSLDYYINILLSIEAREHKHAIEFLLLTFEPISKIFPHFKELYNKFYDRLFNNENYNIESDTKAFSQLCEVSHVIMIFMHMLKNEMSKQERVSISTIQPIFKRLMQYGLHVPLWDLYLNYFKDSSALCNQNYSWLSAKFLPRLEKDNLSVLINSLIFSKEKYAEKSKDMYKALTKDYRDLNKARSLFEQLIPYAKPEVFKLDSNSPTELVIHKDNLYAKMMCVILQCDTADIEVIRPLFDKTSSATIFEDKHLQKLLFNALSRKEAITIKDIKYFFPENFWGSAAFPDGVQEQASSLEKSIERHDEYKMTRLLKNLFQQVKKDMDNDPLIFAEFKEFFAEHIHDIVDFPERLHAFFAHFMPEHLAQFYDALPSSISVDRLRDEFNSYQLYCTRKQAIVTQLNKTLKAMNSRLSLKFSRLFLAHIDSLQQNEAQFFPSKHLVYMEALHKEYQLFIVLANQKEVKGVYRASLEYFEEIKQLLHERDVSILPIKSKEIRRQLQEIVHTQKENLRVEEERIQKQKYAKILWPDVKQMCAAKMYGKCREIERHYSVDENGKDNFDRYLIKIELLTPFSTFSSH